MKKKYLILFCFIICVFNYSFSQVGQWVWLHGNNTSNDPGNFGNIGIPSPTNEPPSMYEACEWTDLNGNFWLYGGLTPTYASRSALWKYDPLTKDWTWMSGTSGNSVAGTYGTKGMPASSNMPPSKSWGAASWTDNNGDLWVFGGMSGGVYNDLWRYNIATNMWTWMSGSSSSGASGVYGTQGVPSVSNVPGARYEIAAAWTTPDASGPGYLWLFGGQGGFNDLWRYRISTNEWTWMKGPNTTGGAGVYGTKGIADPANVPGCRDIYTRWKDKTGKFWIFGGGAPSIYDPHNDLWSYDPSTNNWTWVNGSNVSGAPGIYGAKCVTNSSNVPGGRFENRAAWIDSNGNFWIFGGAVGGSFGQVWNDLWMYCLTTDQWTWEGGDAIPNTAGNWGTKGVSSATNQPPPRAGAISWTDGNDHLYLFGGSYVGWPSNYNDLWMYTIDPSCGTCVPTCAVKADFTSSDTTFCDETGKCIDFFDHSACNPTSWQWIFAGATPSTSTLQNPTGICYYYPGTYEVKLIVTNAASSDTLDVLPHIIFGTAPPPPVITVFGGDTLISTHCSHYQWYRDGLPIAGAIDSFYIATQGGTYSVQGTDNLGCVGLSNGILITGLNPISISDEVTLYPNPVTDELTIVFSPLPLSGAAGEAVITDMVGKEFDKILLYKQQQSYSFSMNGYANGIYLIKIRLGDETVNKKFVVLHN